MQSEACLSKAGSSLYISGNPAIIRTKMKEESNEILVSILRILDKSGFTISQVDSDYCLEIVAKKGSVKLLIKTLENVDDERKESAEDLRSMAATFSASPLVIGSRVQKGVIGESALYERFGINVISPKTFSDAALRGKFPPVYYKRGGLYFRIDGEVLRRLRKERGMSSGRTRKHNRSEQEGSIRLRKFKDGCHPQNSCKDGRGTGRRGDYGHRHI